MAKSVRASVSKRNKAKLRATVFGPVVDERTARLSAKLQELASQPKPVVKENSKMGTEGTESDTIDGNSQQPEADTTEDMDIDKGISRDTQNRSQRSGRIQKRHKKKSSSIVFRAHPSKTRKFSKKK